MNMAVVKSYWRSIQRGTRTLEDVPEPLREAVSKLDTGEEA
ncbi:CD1375 family protein [Colidextribacter sp. OB.20]|nr:CD1375 family protein [Colidextribacter sp. OB.20]